MTSQLFVVRLSKLDSESFNCPECGTVISPDDVEDKNFHIVDSDFTKKTPFVLIECHGCGKQTKLVLDVKDE